MAWMWARVGMLGCLAGRVGFDARVVEDEPERVDVALDGPGGEPFFDQLGDEVEAVPPTKRGRVAVSDRMREGLAVSLVGTPGGGFQVVGVVQPLLVQHRPGPCGLGDGPVGGGVGEFLDLVVVAASDQLLHFQAAYPGEGECFEGAGASVTAVAATQPVGDHVTTLAPPGGPGTDPDAAYPTDPSSSRI